MVTHTFTNGTVADATQVNQNFEDVEDSVNSALGAVAETNYKTLKAAGSFEISDGAYAERYTDSNGVNNTVDTTNSTAIFSTNKYILDVTDTISGGTTHDPNTFTNPTNAFDGNDLTYAQKTGTSSFNTTWSLGKTFTAKNINITKASFYIGMSGTSPSSTITLEYYNGSTWTIFWTNTYTTSTTLTFTANLNMSVQGVRLTHKNNTGTGITWDFRIYLLEAGNYTNSTVIHNTGLGLNNTESVASIYTNTQGSLINSGTGDGSNDTQSFVKTATAPSSTENIKGVKITAKNNVELKQVKLQALDSALTGSVLKIYNSAKSLLKAISTTNTFTTGTADGTDDSSTISATWTTQAGQTNMSGMAVKVVNNCFLKSVTKEASCTATKAYLVANNRIISSATFSGNTATFASVTGQFMEAGNVYAIVCGSDGASHTGRSGATFTTSLNSDLTYYATSSSDSGGIATYVNSTTTSSIAYGGGTTWNITSIVTQTASTPSTRLITSGIDFTLEAGKSYYLMEDGSAYTNFFPSAYTQTFPDTSEADVDLIGGARTSSITDVTTYYGGITELITQNITGSLTPVTGIKVNCSDGTTTTSDVQVDSKGKAIVDISSLGSGSLKVTAKLETTDTSLTPELYGVGVVLK